MVAGRRLRGAIFPTGRLGYFLVFSSKNARASSGKQENRKFRARASAGIN
jgi:hypothetical protein